MCNTTCHTVWHQLCYSYSNQQKGPEMTEQITTQTAGDTDHPAQPYTDAEATDEAVLLLVRRLRRLHPAAYADVLGKLSDGARDALTLADNRADLLRHTGGPRRFVTISERVDAEMAEQV